MPADQHYLTSKPTTRSNSASSTRSNDKPTNNINNKKSRSDEAIVTNRFNELENNLKNNH